MKKFITEKLSISTKRNYKLNRIKRSAFYRDLYPEKLDDQIRIIKASIRRKRTKKEISNALRIAALKTNTFKGLILSLIHI
jgi:hypothetical protein